MKHFYFYMSFIGFVVAAFWYGSTMLWGYQASQYTQLSMNGELTNEQEAAAYRKIAEGPAPLAWWRTRSDLRAHFRLDQLTNERSVHFTQRIPIESLLAVDEEPPHISLYQAYAAARAPAYYAPNCAELLDTIASACKVFHSQGEGPNSHHESVEISSSLAYLPSYPLGDPTTVDNGKMRTAFISVDKDINLLAGDSRRAVYVRARDICAQVRSLLGNCVIEYVRFDDTFLRLTPRAAGTHSQEATIWIAVFLDRTIYDYGDLDPIVENIAEVLAAETG